MNRSLEVGDLITALAKAQAEFTFAAKDSANPAFNSKYADLAANISAVRPALSKHGIALMQFDEADITRQTASVTTALHHGEQWISVTVEAPATGRGGFNVQSLGACWTYLRRYTLQAICGLASDDDDGNSLAVDPKQAEVVAEVARQKKSPADTPELDWNYHKASGVLICRIVEAKKTKKKKGEGDLVTVKLNQPIDGKYLVFYFHKTHQELILTSVGKIAKLIIGGSGDFLSIEDVLEVDGKRIEKPAADPALEAKARLLASTLDLEEEQLNEMFGRYCHGSWPETLTELERMKAMQEGVSTEEPA